MPSSSGNHTKRAAYELRQKIINGKFPGGTRLQEIAMAEALGISRTPAREAMARLAEEGLLERASGGGFLVRSFTRRDVHDAIEMRGVLEGTAARWAAESGVAAEELAEIEELLTRLDDCFDDSTIKVDFDRYSELNGLFHDALAGLSGSSLLVRELERVTKLPFASPSAFVLGSSDDPTAQLSLVTAHAQHRAIVDAIKRREGARAESLAREHARIALANLESAHAGDGDPVPGMALIVD